MSDYTGVNGEGRLQDSASLLDRAIEAVRSEPLCEESLRETLIRLREPATPSSATHGPCRRASHRIGRRWLVAASAAAAMLIAATLWLWHPRASWAEVAEALRGKPWIHAIAKGKSGESHEFWFSAANDVYADRRGEGARFIDSRLRVCYEYQPKEEQILRTVPNESQAGQVLAAFFEGVMRGQMRIGSVFEGQEAIAQEERRIVEDGREWLEYDLTTRTAQDLASDRLARMRFRLDPESHLPHSMTISELAKTGPAANELNYLFDYPDRGPRDIYDLGVSRTVRLIDRVPTADLSQIYAAVEASRNRFDSYLGIVVGQGKEQPWHAGRLKAVVWRKDVRWRVELAMFRQSPPPPESDADQVKWWKQQLAACEFSPIEVCDGQTVYHCNQGRWTATRTIEPKRGLQAQGQAADSMAEMSGYPVSLEDKKHLFTATLETQPNDGPADSLLVHYQATGAVKDESTFRDLRYWVDPGKGDVTLQERLAGARDPDGSTTTVTRTSEEFERSPRGIWYPTLVRETVVRDPPGAPSQESEERVTRFFLDFEADVPDELFQPVDRPK
ncbi:MAG TPA: hypothetical protein VG826_02435 [Pirellulales bacterium]|nr:hypothetical protein [Pirellulales bacterium]